MIAPPVPRRGIFLLTLGVLACGGADIGQSSAQGVAVAVVPDSVTLAPAAQQDFATAVTGAVDTSVTWGIVEGSQGGRVTASGGYSAPSTPGSYHVVATSVADPAKSATATVTVTYAAASLSLSPSSNDFGNVALGAASAPQSFTIRNSGSAAAGGVYVALTGGAQFSLGSNACGTSSSKVAVAGGGSCSFSITFTPASAGSQTGTVTVSDDAGQTITAALSGAGLSGTTSHGLVIPAGHPRLWFNAARLASARSWYAAHPYTVNNDSGWEWTFPGWADTAMRGLLNTGNPADQSAQCNAAIAAATTGAISASVFRTSGVSCDQCRWFGEQVIAIYDWCWAYMTPSQRSSFIAAHNPWVQHWSTTADGGWGQPPMHQNNYYWGYSRNSILWAIATYDENRTVAEALLDNALTTRLGNDFFPAASTGDSRGGAFVEGTEYGSYMSGYTVLPFTTAALLGNDLYSATNFYKEAVYYYLYATTPAPTHAEMVSGTGYTLWSHSEDESWTRSPSILGHDVVDFMAAAAAKWGNINVGKHARQWLATTGMPPSHFVQAVDPGGTALSFSGLPLDYYAPGARWLYSRNAWGPSATTVWLEMGDRNYTAGSGQVGHTHEDFGTWQMWRNGYFLSRESVGYGETIAGKGGSGSVPVDAGLAHNALLVNGGSISAEYDTGASVTVPRLESQPRYSYAVANLTPLRSKPNGNAAWVSGQREFVFVRDLEALVVFDRVESSSASATKTFVAHCATTPAVGTGTATCTNGTQSFVMTTLVPASSSYHVVSEGTAFVGQYRIEADTTPGTAQSYILTVVQAKDSGAASLSPTVTDNGSSYTVRLNGSNSITFNKGMVSSGGSITTASGTTALRADAQSMSVTDDGPGWH